MNRPVTVIAEAADVWSQLRSEVEQELAKEPLLSPFLTPVVLQQESFGDALGAILGQKLFCPAVSELDLRRLCGDAYSSDPSILESACSDLRAVTERDPACDRVSMPFLYFKGFQGLQLYRVTHWLWQHDRQPLARYLQSRISETFAIDIHPAARIGNGILIDHATSIVIGETAVIGDNVSLLHEVTLGGTGKEAGDRHPKIADGVLIGAGAKVLGNVQIGEGAKIGAGSVVLNDVPAHRTVAGVPARPVGPCTTDQPALEMDHSLES